MQELTQNFDLKTDQTDELSDLGNLGKTVGC